MDEKMIPVDKVNCPTCPYMNNLDAARLVHDLTGILQVMLSDAQLVLMGGGTSPAQRTQAFQVITSIDSAILIIEEFRVQGSAKPLDFALAVRNSLESLRPLAVGQGVVLDLLLPLVPTDMTVRIYPGEVHRILQNLVVNSIQACQPQTGQVTVRLNTVESDRRQKSVQLTIKDNGHGMDDQTLPHIFEAGYTTKETGSGLGLCTVEMLVSRRHGKMTVDSHLNQGTTVTIDFPCAALENVRSA